jgi:hypothetical protein
LKIDPFVDSGDPMRRFALLFTAALCCLPFTASCGRADTDVAAKVHIRVVDAHGAPVPYATLWLDQGEIDALALAMQRFADDGDVAYWLGPLHGIFVRHADDKGRFELQIEQLEFHGRPSLPLGAVAMKRGFAPALRSVEVGKGETELMVRLVAIPGPIDAELAEFDRLRGEYYMVYEAAAPDAMEKLQSLSSRIRALASKAEQAGRKKAASKIYFGLSELPTIDVTRDENGTMVASGYTSSYDKADEVRNADRHRANWLDPANPNPAWWSLQEEFDDAVANARESGDSGQRATLQDIAGRALPLWNEHRRELWPMNALMLIDLYADVQDYDAACRVLQQAQAENHELLPSDYWPSWRSSVVGVLPEDEKARNVSCPLPEIASKSGGAH